MTCMSMYKSTEISIPVKVDKKFDLCPFLPLLLPRHHPSSPPPLRPPIRQSYILSMWVKDDNREKEKHSFQRRRPPCSVQTLRLHQPAETS